MQYRYKLKYFDGKYFINNHKTDTSSGNIVKPNSDQMKIFKRKYQTF